MILTSPSTLSTLYLLGVLAFHHLKTLDQKKTGHRDKKLARVLMFHFRTKRAKWRVKDFHLVKPVSMCKDIMNYFKLEDTQFCFFSDFERKPINDLYCV